MTKYFYLLMPALLIFCTSRAQIKKGEVFLGGVLQHSNADNSSYNAMFDTGYNKQKFTTVGPTFGWAIKDNLEFGVRVTYSFSNSDQYVRYENPPTEYKNFNHFRGYTLNTYLRRYKELGHGFAVYGEGDLTGSIWTSTEVYNNVAGLYVDQKSWNVAASASAGVSYRPSHRWMFETGFVGLLSMGYGQTKDKGQDVPMNGASSKTDYFSIGTGFSRVLSNLSLGCRYILN